MGFDRQLLNQNLLEFLDPEILGEISLHIFEVIPSTNQKLWELIEGGETLPIVAIAQSQTAGRGQWGRTWQSEPGGLYLSLGLATRIDGKNAAHLTILSAWGIASALRDRGIPVSLKWPNDLILQGRKLGGIKSETRIQQGEIARAVIGAGINWANPVPGMGINLQSFSPSIASLEMLAAIAIFGLFSGYRRYLAEGIEPLLQSYSDLLNTIGREVAVNGCPGVAIGVNSDGELRVRLNSPGAVTEICLQPGQISLGY